MNHLYELYKNKAVKWHGSFAWGLCSVHACFCNIVALCWQKTMAWIKQADPWVGTYGSTFRQGVILVLYIQLSLWNSRQGRRQSLISLMITHRSMWLRDSKRQVRTDISISWNKQNKKWGQEREVHISEDKIKQSASTAKHLFYPNCMLGT